MQKDKSISELDSLMKAQPYVDRQSYLDLISELKREGDNFSSFVREIIDLELKLRKRRMTIHQVVRDYFSQMNPSDTKSETP